MSTVNDFVIDKEDLEFNDPPKIIWIPVQIAVNLLWVDNSKHHALGQVEHSIMLHGFQALPKFDANLQNVGGTKGAIKAGNGRIETLALMENNPDILKQLSDEGMKCPRGLAVDKKFQWVMPIMIGTDAKSLELAMAYAIDDNNLTMAGSDFSDFDIARMWDAEGYSETIEKILAVGDETIMPVTIPFDDAPYLINGLRENPPPSSTGKTFYKVTVWGLGKKEAEELRKQIGKGEVETYTVKE